MNRLDTELRRLYLPAGPAAATTTDPTRLVAPDGRVRALVLELARPANWNELSRAWKGVQTELEMPAPAIAVDGKGAYQLWFSLAEPVEGRDALKFLDALRTRFLAEVAPGRIRLEPAHDASGSALLARASPLPPAEVAPGQWSAFVTSDLAPLFVEEPWLDHPPGIDAQADLLSRVASVSTEIFVRASARLEAAASSTPSAVAGPAPAPAPDPMEAAGEGLDPRSFLLQVMRDPSVDLRLRIEAAKALLP